MKKNNIQAYFNRFKSVYDGVVVTDSRGRTQRIDEAVGAAVRTITRKASKGGAVFLIGNGASASIASHIATDLWKNGGIKARAFNDSSLLTCISNDFGYEYVFEKPIEMFAGRGDVLVAISSSGRSENVLRGVSAAKKKKAGVITLSGFDKDNPLRRKGDINFYVPAKHYGYVETIHTLICHSLVDTIIETKNG